MNIKNYSDLTVIIPVINEKDNLIKLIPIIMEKYPGSTVIIADDGSSDGTSEVIPDLVSQNSLIDIIYLERANNTIIEPGRLQFKDKYINDSLNIRNVKGLTSSVLDSISVLNTDYFVVIDGDLQHPPHLIGMMYEKVKNSDIVTGFRADLGDFKFHRKIITFFGTLLSKLTLPKHSRVTDPLSGAFAGRSNTIRKFTEQTDKFRLEGFKVLYDLLKILPKKTSFDEVGYDFQTRQQGNSKIGFKQLFAFFNSLFDKKTKVQLTGILTVSILSIAGFILILIFGDLNITSTLRSFALSNPNFLKACKIITDYGNPLYYLCFISALLYGIIKKKKNIVRIVLLYMLVQFIASFIITGSIKSIVGRPRPGKGFEFRHFTSSSKFKSFPSGHTTDAFSSCGSIWGFSNNFLLPSASMVFSLTIGLTRVFVGSHYFLDVIAGMLVGFLTGIIVFRRKY